MSTKKRTRIVVIGAGFGGLYAFKKLHSLFHNDTSVELTLLSKESSFLFTPLLHEVATGGVSPENVVEPLRKIFRCCSKRISICEVTKISCKRNEIETSIGSFPFDYCILSPGAETNFFDAPGAPQHSFLLKSVDDAIRLKNHFIRICERAAHTTDPKELEALLRIVIVGGGATGVELAAEVAEYFYDTFPRYYRNTGFLREARIVLLQRGNEIIPQFPAALRKKALKVLLKKGVDVRLDTAVKAVKTDAVELTNGERLSTHTPIWVAGVSPLQLTCDTKLPYDGCRLLVNEHLQLQGRENIFVIGDAALCKDDQGRPIPSLAQSAVQQGDLAASNIARMIKGKKLVAFSFNNRGSLLSLGQWKAVADIKGLQLSGPFAWWLWRTIYFSKLISWDHKIKVGVDWFLDIFTPRDISDI